ncbi:hypothetical protein A2U01_0093001, partial [Trifolium medium]|nr:hypothetical protein [Trifolium medium]
AHTHSLNSASAPLSRNPRCGESVAAVVRPP